MMGTCFRDGYKTYLFRMAKDGRSIDRSSARLINEGNGREASKLIWHDGYYYLVFSEHRNGVGRYVMAKRDRKMTGSFSEERQLLLPCCEANEANEPNQGGIIGRPDGKWYFLTHHGTGDWSGRIVSLLLRKTSWHSSEVMTSTHPAFLRNGNGTTSRVPTSSP